MTETDQPPSSLPFTHPRVSFCFVPLGATLPEDWAAAHPGWVKFPATLRMRPGSALPPGLLLSAEEDADRSPPPYQTQRHPDGQRLIVPPIADQPEPPPRLPARAPVPAFYANPHALTGAVAGRPALIRSAQITLDTLARQAAARAAVLAADGLADLSPPIVAGAILLKPEPAGAGEEQALRRALARFAAEARPHRDIPPPSPPLPGLVPPGSPKRKPGEGGFTPSPPTKPNLGFTPAPPPTLVRPGRPAIENRPVILDSRKDKPHRYGDSELSRILAPDGKIVGWIEPRAEDGIRTVDTAQFDRLRRELLSIAVLVNDSSRYPYYRGNAYELPSGEVFGLRPNIRHGETIDILHSNQTDVLPDGFKVHQK